MTENPTPRARPERPRTSHSPHLGPNREYWLHRLIRHSRERNWCTDPGCTTCGAHRFRDALRAEAFRTANRIEKKTYDRVTALHLSVALASLHPDREEATALEGPVRIALRELLAGPLDRRLIEDILEGHWAGAVQNSDPCS